jgi:hypothetical protein
MSTNSTTNTTKAKTIARQLITILRSLNVALARTLMGVGANMGSGASVAEVAPPAPLPPAQAQPNAFDPYAGASVPQ